MLAMSLLMACVVTRGPVQDFAPSPGQPRDGVDWTAVLASPVDVSVESISFALSESRTAGLVNLNNPQASSLTDTHMPIAITAHVITHPTQGTVMVDSGLSLKDDGTPNMRGLVSRVFSLDVQTSTAASVDGVRAVYMTHMHPDHLLGLPDIPDTAPVRVGPGETALRSGSNVLLRRNLKHWLGAHPIEAMDFSAGDAIDVFGDGSFWALHVPGHTPGSVAYLVNAQTGPVLLTGDACHTRWGWAHGVEPGWFSEDIPGSVVQLDWMRALVAAHPQLAVAVGHELPHVPGEAIVEHHPDEHHATHGAPHGESEHHSGMPHRFDDVERWAAVFDAPERDTRQRPVEVVEAMAISEGMAVADIGAGTGYFMPHLAAAVGVSGQVYAVDVEDSLVNHLSRRAHSAGFTQVRAVRGDFDDPHLDPGSVDRILIVNTYHHIQQREDYFTRLQAALRPGGQLIIVDYTMESEHGPPPEHRLSQSQVTDELTGIGWVLERAPAILEDQYVLVFSL